MKILVVLMVIVVVAFFLGGMFFSKTVVIEERTLMLRTEETSTARIFVPAVDENGQGLITTITVEVAQGSGQTLTSIENILFFVDTQHSIRIARDVAADLTRFDLSEIDLTYTIQADASVIEGPSAGAALTIATIAALEGQTLNQNVMITGTIREDGSIGRVGKVYEKSRAAAEGGATLFLVPRGSGFSVNQGTSYQRVLTCSNQDGLEICETSYEPVAGSGPGIQIKEVATIEEALPYFIEGAS